MRIIIISEYNLATSIGGTETYVELLIRGLVESGNTVILITQGKKSKPSSIEKVIHMGYTCYYLPIRNYAEKEIKQEVVSSTWPEIKAILTEEQPDIVHVHTLSTFFNKNHLILCKGEGHNLLFTSHIAGHFCSRGDLVRYGLYPCDGIVGVKCMSCLFSKGLEIGLRGVLKGHYKRSKKLLTFLNKNGIGLVCVSEWQKMHAVSNGFSENNVTVIRQANSNVPSVSLLSHKGIKSEKLRIGYLGRLAPEKGSDFLMRFIERINKKVHIEFVLAIPVTNSHSADIMKLEALQKKTGGKIRIMTNITSANKSDFFSVIDCLFIPSFAWETGPIVLLEALSFCKQVLAPNIGGTAEFAIQFPSHVHVYDWQSEISAEGQVETIEIKRNHSERCTAIYNELKDMEISFIAKHLHLYKETLKNKFSYFAE